MSKNQNKKIAQIELLPLAKDVETVAVLKQVALAERVLGELKGTIQRVPNELVLINTLFLQEAKASSEIENIVTTHDEVFRTSIGDIENNNAKEVKYYEDALSKGFEIVKNQKLLLNKHIKKIQQILESNNAGFRTNAGTTLQNPSQEVVYTPPQNSEDIVNLMSNLESYINDNDICKLNPLIKMAIIHHQFESIHPFYDGNGRTGRIINILYLTLQNLLDIPILYLSRYIIDNKQSYYTLLQSTRDDNTWEEWILFMLKGVEETSKQTTLLVEKIVELMLSYKKEIREKYPRFYSQDLINSLFKYPYTKISFLTKDLQCSRQTASRYLNALALKDKYLRKIKIKNSHYYINQQLINLFLNH